VIHKLYLSGNIRAQEAKLARLLVRDHLAEAELQNYRFTWAQYQSEAISVLPQFFTTSLRNILHAATVSA
jgi:hypothetical protein